MVEGVRYFLALCRSVDGARVRRQTGSTTTFYTGGSDYERNGSSGAFTHYYNVGGDTVAYNNNGTLTFMWADYVNSTSLTRTGTTNKIQRYTPWGETRTNGNLTTDHHYTGQIADEDTGLAFYNARYYDTTIGRFISPDTIIPNGADGQDYNRYAYVRNNPAIHTDPTGHCPADQRAFGACAVAYGNEAAVSAGSAEGGYQVTVYDDGRILLTGPQYVWDYFDSAFRNAGVSNSNLVLSPANETLSANGVSLRRDLGWLACGDLSSCANGELYWQPNGGSTGAFFDGFGPQATPSNLRSCEGSDCIVTAFSTCIVLCFDVGLQGDATSLNIGGFGLATPGVEVGVTAAHPCDRDTVQWSAGVGLGVSATTSVGGSTGYLDSQVTLGGGPSTALLPKFSARLGPTFNVHTRGC